MNETPKADTLPVRIVQVLADPLYKPEAGFVLAAGVYGLDEHTLLCHEPYIATEG